MGRCQANSVVVRRNTGVRANTRNQVAPPRRFLGRANLQEDVPGAAAGSPGGYADDGAVAAVQASDDGPRQRRRPLRATRGRPGEAVQGEVASE
jgi:hypothetical protein